MCVSGQVAEGVSDDVDRSHLPGRSTDDGGILVVLTERSKEGRSREWVGEDKEE